ncbi:MAG: efflux RND transporter periplasmic adaptor subunit [Gemmatimonadales bacterium]|nr:efflux RND transporter periplasmic adaptor subunit [Gemmatimonadales bacterium]
MNAMTWSHLRYPALLAVLAFAGCKGKPADRAEAETPPVVLGRENVAVVADTQLQSGPTISGTLAAEREADVRAEVGGSVIGIAAEQGQPVKQGAVLARIDDTSLRDQYLSSRAAVRTASENLQVTRRNTERAARLAEAGAVAERELEQSRASATSAAGAVADAQARLAMSSRQLSKTTIRAPFSGIVSERQVSAGDVVSPGALLFTVIDPASMRLEASVAADQLGALKAGALVDFTVNGFADRRFEGRIERINPTVDRATGQVRIYVSIPNAGRTLVGGLFAQGRVATVTERGLTVPSAAIDERGTKPMVLVLRNSRVQHVPVELGIRDDVTERVLIRSGVAAGDTVLLGSAQGLSDGAVVRLRKE